ncbi:hypothetical protein, partial [Candidatus Caldatribacterium sp.]|uniref:hypothetical protein n=1 Tax=Candidatus Caldatribacterium sp. TaxID=2282143 RepID=UPI003842F899|nr:hypothetical protein [Candidatus Caldatribacterium sp.]
TNYPKVTTPEGVMTFLFPYRTYPDHPAQPRNSRYWLFDTVTPQGIDLPQTSHIGQACGTMATTSTTYPTPTTIQYGRIVVSFLISASALCTKHRIAMRASAVGGYGQIPYGMDVYGSVTQTYQIG